MKRSREEIPAATLDAESVKKKRKWKDAVKFSIFMNQLPYDANEKMIRKFVCSVDGIKDDNVVNVRRVMFPKTNKFKGIAFVEMDSEENRIKVLQVLDQQKLMGRKVNVKPCETSQDKLVTSIEEVENLFKEALGKAGAEFTVQTMFNKTTQKFMMKLDPATLKRAFKKFVKKDLTSVEDMNAFMTKVLDKAKEKPKQKDKEKQPNKKTKDGKKPIDKQGKPEKQEKRKEQRLSVDEIWAIVKQAAKPRRAKKKDGKGRGSIPQDMKDKWSNFSKEAIQVMQEFDAPSLKRVLSKFYRLDLEKIKDEDKADKFLLMLKDK